ncbi:hypothetical protein HanRHA438_Chr10g0435241 [Helianthus annuus]|nr:hypothetical protein HanRHA438_Chr10g0435241 [Helianthus annuus]
MEKPMKKGNKKSMKGRWIVLRPKRVVRKSSTPFQRRKQRNGCIYSLIHTLNLLYIDFTLF